MSNFCTLDLFKSRASLLCAFLFFAIQINVKAQCPDIEIIDLRGTPGFAQLDDLTACGEADTLSLIIYTGDPGDVKGFELELSLPDGIEYDGWEFTSYSGTSISNVDPTESCPEFVIDGFGGDSLIVVNIGLRTNCDISKDDPLFIHFEYDLVFIDTLNQIHKCGGIYTPDVEYNSAINIPVVNVLSPLDEPEITMTAIGDIYCQNVSISQDGLSSYLDSFRIELAGLEFGSGLNLTSVTANPGAGDYPVSFTHDAGNAVTSLLLEDYMFVGNLLANPNNNRFNTNEIIVVEFCYSLDFCPSSADLPFVYNASFGCDGDVCQLSSKTSFIRVRPTGSELPTATTTLISAPFVCGEDGEVALTVTNPNTDTDQNKYIDLSVGFETCESPNLEITKVSIGGVELPTNTFGWVGDDLSVDFSALPPGLDIDGPGGLEDLDGDLIFDDIAGGVTIPLSIFLGVTCGSDIPDPSSAVCPGNDCPFTQFYVSAKTNCGSSFKEFPDGIAGFSIKHGATFVDNPNQYPIPIANPALSGYDFGVFGDLGTSASPDTVAATQEVIFCYDFESENFNGCTDNELFFQITFAGAEGYIYDIDMLSAELSIDGGLTYTSSADMATDTSWLAINEETRQLIVNLGSVESEICYKYVLELDSAWCPPPAYWFGTQQVFERCNDASCGPDGCDMVRACNTATFYGNAESWDCPCVLEGDLTELYRKNYGYTDATKTTKLTRDQVDFDDQSRFLPCDTMVVDYYWIITDQHILDNVDLARFTLEHWYRGNTTGGASVATAELMPNPETNELLELSVQKVGVPFASRQILDLGAIEACAGSGFSNGFETTPWTNTHVNATSNSSADVNDGTFTRFILYNYDRINECKGSATDGGDCLDEFLAITNYEAGDTIRIMYSQEMMKNPYRQAYISAGLDPGPASEDHTIVASGYIDMIDANGGGVCNTRVGDDCAVNPVFKGTCPGFVSSLSQIDLNACGGSVEHTFYMNAELPAGWFEDEYRPIFNLMNVTDPLFAPMAFCGNAEIINYANGVPMSISVSPDSTTNLFCVTVEGFDDEVCAIESGDSGDLTWNPLKAGAMGLGIGNVDGDSLKIKYDFCLICPELINVLDYQMTYDYGYMCNTIPGKRHYDCDATTPDVCVDLNYPNNSDFWIERIQDSMFVSLGNLGPNVTISDTRTPIQNATASLGTGASTLIASGSPAVSEEIQAIDICNPDDTQTATGVGASIKIPSSIRLVDVYTDAAGVTSLDWELVSDNGTEKTYAVTLPSDTFTPEECYTIYVGTTLLFCPNIGDLPPTVCVVAVSGCSPVELTAALSEATGCGTNDICYSYISGEVGLQTEWFDFPDKPQLCEEMTFNVLVKNVKQLVLLDLEPEFLIPPGLTIVAGSWEVAYPGGPTTMGAWVDIPTDPDVVNGNSFSYSEDALWNSVIDMDGLEGVSFANATEDLNKVAFRFRAVTNCDEFLSGSKLITETIAADPCADGNTSSGVVESPPLIIEGADPAVNAQLLIIAEPEELNCMASVNTFGITAINVSDYATSDSVQTCVTFPAELQYVPNSITVVQPTGFVVTVENITVIGDQTEVCFVSPKIGQSQSMKITFDAMVDDMASCGDIPLQVDIKSVQEAVTCNPGPPDACDVFVQNSLNPSINIEIKPPFIADELLVFTDCSSDPSIMDLYYEWTINHNGPNASDQAYTVNFYMDVDGDMSINSNIDNLVGTESGTFSVLDGSSILVSGNVSVEADKSCPVLFEVIYETECTCDREEMYFDNIPNKALRDYTEPIAMCPGDCFDIEVCDFVEVTADSISGATGIEYLLSLDWNRQNCYTIPHDTLPDGSIMRGPTSAFLNFAEMNNNSIGSISGEDGFVFAEQGTSCGAPTANGDAYLVADFGKSVSVDSIFIGSGEVAGWSNTLSVYSGTALKLEYSLDGTTWVNSGTALQVASPSAISGHALPASIDAQYWRLSSNSVNANWGTTEFRLEGEGIPFEAAAPVTVAGNIVTICIPEDQGIDAPWAVTFTTGTGQCTVEETIEIWNIGDLEVDAGEDQIYCEGDLCLDLEGILPNDVDDTAITVQWTPTTGLSDPNSLETEACITEDITYTLEVTFPGGCIKTDQVSVDYRALPPTPAAEIVEVCSHPDPDTLFATIGFSNYVWFEEIGGNQIPATAGPDNFYLTTNEGLYTVKAYDDTNPCPVNVEVFELVYKECLDLELTKNIVNVPSPLTIGSQVTYEIEVCNINDPAEGLVFDASNVEVSDEMPGAVSYVQHTQTSGNYSPTSNDWTISTLENGTCDTLWIDVTLDDYGTIQNTAQVSDVDQEDIDSDPNNDDGDQSEDEEDNAEIALDTFDLALTKVLSPTQLTPVLVGDDVTFTIEVCNQGTIDAYEIEVADYLPIELELNDTDWTTSVTGEVFIIIPGPIEVDMCESVDITTTVTSVPANGIIENFAEISDAEDITGNHPPDIDSDPDNDPSNDGPVEDDDTDNTNGDEDDHDPAYVPIEVFDLALTKTVSATQTFPLAPGDDVTFTLTVSNQGTIDAFLIDLVDYIPEGLSLNDADWTEGPTDVADLNTAIAGPLAAGTSTTVDITFTIDADFMGSSITNYSEISSADNDMDTGNTPPTDIDSDPDAMDDNDGPSTDNDTDNTDGDEDDHDPETILLDQTFDLALQKVLDPAQVTPVAPGDDVSYNITVYNQGTLDAYNIEVVDYVPSGMLLNDATWTAGSPITEVYQTIAGPIVPGDSVVLSLVLQVDPNLTVGDDLQNFAEISSAEDVDGNQPTDVDSTPDNDPDNDGAVDDNTTDNANGDEDDHDPAIVPVEIFDLALVKTVSSTQVLPVGPGDDITYTLTVSNQGNVDAFLIDLVDYIPEGLSLNDTDWTEGPTDVADLNTAIAGPLAAGTSTTVDITFTIDADFMGSSITNYSEISSADNDMDTGNTPPTDIDSDPDAMDDNDGPSTDNDTDNTNGDEDDHDPETIVLNQSFDLALQKVLDPAQVTPVAPGDDVSYNITVYNQGTLDAYNVEVVDYVPSGMLLNDATWTAGNPTTEVYQTIAGPIVPGDSMVLTLVLQVDPNFAGGSLENFSEISSAEDVDGNQPTDSDSTPDNDPDNDGAVDDNTTDNANGDEDDHDPAIVDVEIFDLALKKVISPDQSMPIYLGDDITFIVTVYNQGTVDAYNVDVVDYYPPSTSLSSNVASTWTDDGNGTTASQTITGPLAAGDSMQLEIVLTLDPSASAGSFENFAEITGAEDDMGNPQDDIDSTPDSTGGDSGDDVDNVTDGTGGDEDDSDPAPFTIEVFDLALTKILDPNQSVPVYPGDDVTFIIEVFNQGTIDAYNVDVVDYIPAGFVLNDPTWVPAPMNTATQMIAGPITPGNSTQVSITLTATASVTGGNTTNTAEISDAEDEDGNHPDDVDSFADDDPNNEGTVTDDVTDGTGGDEDDSDPAVVPVAIFDLALEKVLATGQDPIVTVGDDVTFTIIVTNQGTVDAYNVDVVDYIPVGMSLNDSDWTAGAGNAAFISIPGPIAAGTSTTVDITVAVDALPSSGLFENFAEITDGEDVDGNHPTDIDSTPDSDPLNDGPVTDGDTDGTGPSNGEDEDDHDPAVVGVQVFDLALQKVISPDQQMPIYPGDDVSFVITLFNQGTVDAYNIDVVDYYPTSTTLSTNDTNGWVDNGNSTASVTFPGPLAAGSNTTLEIVLTLSETATGGSFQNLAEISEAEDVTGEPQDDIDSTPDADQTNDPEDDNITDGTNGDEDDADPAPFTVEVFDLALTKILSPAQATPVYPGDEVTFIIEVSNQGTVDAYNVEVTDFIPSGLTLNDTDWIGGVMNTASTIIAGPITPGNSMLVEITLTVNSDATAGNLENTAEISDAEDENGVHPEDVDSTPDDTNGNDGPVTDDVTDGTGGDEDDSDPAIVPIEVFDLALEKVLASGQDPVVTIGDDVTYDITIFNQGSIDAYNVEIVDYIPTGMSLNDGAWTSGTGNSAYTTEAGPIAAGGSVTVSITVTVDAFPANGIFENFAEIADAEDEDGNHPVDVDSTPDDDDNNDGPVTDGDIDGGGLDEGEDEDDHDPAVVGVEVFDLALQKVMSPSQAMPIYPGDDVTFVITVFNQGTVDAYNVDVIDYIPVGMILSTNDANGWTENGFGDAVNTYTGPLAAGTSTEIEIVLTLSPTATSGSYNNVAEITEAEDETGTPQDDIDSTPDGDPANDPQDDNVTDNSNGDEDDSDPAPFVVEIFDLALTKVLSPSQTTPVYPGDDVTFLIEVSNQGTLDAYNVEVIDYIPAGFTLNDPTWDAAAGNSATQTIAGPITPGNAITVSIVVSVDANTNAGDATNFAEISDAQDEEGNHPEDIDSTPDDDNTNDGPVTDDVTDGTDGDEDDHDPAVVPVAVFDLALQKVLASGQNATVAPGDDVTYTLTVFNQGSIDAYNVDVVDYFPAGMSLNDSDWTAGFGNQAYITVAGPIAAGGSTTVDITLTVDTYPSSGMYTNFAEIADAEDMDGNHPADVDSDPDSDPSNDGPYSDNDVDGTGGDEDDHDPAVINVAIFDLALTKVLSPTQVLPVAPGDDVTFTIEVINQGTQDAYNVEVTDYIPTDMILNDADWNLSGGVATQVLAGPIAAGTSTTVDITLTIDDNFMGTSIENVAEISEADNDTDPNNDSPIDIDSNPDGDDSNDGDVTDNSTDGTGGDEDDSDPAVVPVGQVFDLALTKVLDPSQATPVYPGDDVVFFIEVSNQGTLDAYNIEVVDYIPSGFILNDPTWIVGNASDEAYQTIAGPLAAGSSTTLSITLTVDPDLMAGASLENFAEISEADDDTDPNNEPPVDTDSDPDNDPDNDGPYSDNDTDGTNGDEDDSDPAIVPVDIFDLAIDKSIADAQVLPVEPGDEITFTLQVINQGTVDAYAVEITDNIPAGLILNDSDWTLSGGVASYVVAGPIAAGQSSSVDITFTIDASFMGNSITNAAEISAADDDTDPNNDPPVDLDSDPDNDDGDQSEDDEDPETIPLNQVFDLALTKVLDPAQATPVSPGDDVSFLIEVSNQGTLDAYNVEIVDYIPSGMLLNDSDWSVGSDPTEAYQTIAGPIASGSSVTVSIVLQVDPSYNGSGSLQNFAEIAAADDDTDPTNEDPTDIDSDPDSDQGNDGDYTDNDVDGTDGDEDDADPADVFVEVFDLALTKTLSSTQALPVAPGDDVTFTVTVWNQGNVDAYAVELTDYIPTGMSLNDADWTMSGDVATYTVVGPLAPGTSEEVEITMTIDSDFMGSSIDNVAEISAADNDTDPTNDDPTDVDSDPDGDDSNDGPMEDDVTDGTNGDEDDSDPATVPIGQVFDLALTKVLDPAQATPVSPGDDVSFLIEVSNQGTLDAYNVEIVDYIPSGMLLNDSDWSVGSDPTEAYQTIAGPIASGSSVTVSIVLQVDPSYNGSGSLQNFAEIAAADDDTDPTNEDPTDIDSDPDSDQGNDGDYTDNDVDGTDGDEDDADPADVFVEVFDLALTKTLSSTQALPVAPGDDVTFTVTVWNQGNVDAYAVELTDYLPTGMSLNDADWTMSGDVATYTVAGPLAPGTSEEVEITMTIDSDFMGSSIDNVAEISAADNDTDPTNDDPTDVDSDPDGDDSNDGPMEDDVTDGTNGDEDDSDPATVPIGQVFDLALTKVLDPAQATPVSPGDDVSFLIEVSNQGTLDAYNVEIVDYIPSGMLLNDSDWSVGSDPTEAYQTIAGPIASGSSVTVSIVLQVDPSYNGSGSLQNFAEISAADDDTDPTNEDPTDIDSDPDSDQGNDGDYTDNDVDGTDGDEDDADPADVFVEVFDLALTKTLSSTQALPVAPGDDVTFTVTVWNQGNVDAYAVELTDYLPTGMSLNDADWTMSGDVATYTVAGPLAPGTSEEVEITMTIDSDFMGSSIDNVAEISAADNDTDPTNDDPTDVDSDPDGDDSNDGDVTDNSTDGTGGDEDDSDPATVPIGQVFDLALTKTLAPGENGNVAPGSMVDFIITVENQGTLDAYNVLVVDYLPTGVSLSDTDWSTSATPGEVYYTIPGPIAAGSSAEVSITVLVDSDFEGSAINYAEIADAEDEDGNHPDDIDSTPDDDNTNDGPISDDDTDGTNGDEDDHDPAEINVGYFDLALVKMVSPSQTFPVYPGDNVNFIIEVINQGDFEAYNIEIVDFIPTGMSLNDTDWTDNSDGTATYVIAGPLATGSSQTVEVTMTIDASFTGTSLENEAEIASADDDTDPNNDPPVDVDSNPDNDNTNDGPESDDDVDGTDGDEDDSDPAVIQVGQPFDLALTKMVSASQSYPINPGDIVSFDITVFNQGDVDAYAIEITDFIPTGLVLADGSWFDNNDGTASYDIAGPLSAGSSTTVAITFVVDPNFSGTSITNEAEISGADDDTDPNNDPPIDDDSTPDNDNTNDGPETDDDVDGSNGDEDDSDPATIPIGEDPTDDIFDLALTKGVSSGQTYPINPGDIVSFDITVYNQGNVDAYDIDITDFIPTGLVLSDANWTNNNDGTASYNIAGPLNAGSSTTVAITFVVDPNFSGTSITNEAEISGADDDTDPTNQDPVDDDSTADDDNTNDGPETDDDVNGTNGDEDDSDPATIPIGEDPTDDIFDLALTKGISDTQDFPINPGDPVTFVVTVYNQGTVDAYAIELTDFIPAGLILSDANWTNNNDGTASYTIAGPLAAGSATSITIDFIVDPSFSGNVITNEAEISGADDDTDPTNQDPVDDDSTADNDNTNDGPETDDSIDGTNGDEDDSDLATIILEDDQISGFDLALTKVVSANQTYPVNPGDLITFTINVINQGIEDAYSIEVTDFIPTGLFLNDSDWTNNNDGTASYLINGPLVAGSSTSVDITFVVDPGFTGDSITNEAEISGADNDTDPK